MLAGIDFETFGTVDLRSRGRDNYFADPKFRPLLAYVAPDPGITGNGDVQGFDFVTKDRAEEADRLGELIKDSFLVAHRASFERSVLRHMGLHQRPVEIADSAVIARAAGASSSLANAAPQLLGSDKMEEGVHLIKKFSMPLPDGRVMVDEVDSWTQEDWDDWETFKDYCALDAVLSRQLFLDWGGLLTPAETAYELITQEMNDAGWRVDMDLVERMSQQYAENKARIESEFRRSYDPKGKLNFRSTPQLRKWCKDRGVNAKSFDEQNTAYLLKRVTARIARLTSLSESVTKTADLVEVRAMLQTKQALGGSSLSKLETIKKLVGPDGRLREQYLHVGAGQTYRTSGTGVQMQNLKRLGPEIGDVDGDLSLWSNDDLARNLRQVFTAADPQGELIVGDFSSVESRGLAWLARAEWKLEEYRKGRDMYKVQASSMLDIPYDRITKEQRQTGKVGELSCGYGAGGSAVQRFAEKMGVPLTSDQAGDIVSSWRTVNIAIVNFWKELDEALHAAINGERMIPIPVGPLASGFTVTIQQTHTPQSILDIVPKAQSLMMIMRDESGRIVLRRDFQGCFMDGRDVCYVKPSELKGGKPWLTKWTKDGQSGRYKLYGGKLAGILTQSFCREIFFGSLKLLSSMLHTIPNAQIVGQFHDEIVVEWSPPINSREARLTDVIQRMDQAMTRCNFPGFPLEADIKHAYRYIK